MQRRRRASFSGQGEMPPAVPRPLRRESSWVTASVFCSCCGVSPALLPLGSRARGVSWLLPTTAGFPLSSAMCESRIWPPGLGLQDSGRAHPAADAAGQIKLSSSGWEPCTCLGRLALVQWQGGRVLPRGSWGADLGSPWLGFPARWRREKPPRLSPVSWRAHPGSLLLRLL